MVNGRSIAVRALLLTLGIAGLLVSHGAPTSISLAQGTAPIKLAIIHTATGVAFPDEITVVEGTELLIYHTSLDVEHNPVVLINTQTEAIAFGLAPFVVKKDQITETRFVAKEAGEYLFSHRLHGHPTQIKLKVIKPM